MTQQPLEFPEPQRLALRVTTDGQRAVRRGHPWLFDRAVFSQSAEGRPGDLAVIFDDRRRFLAVGLFDPASPIRVRILQHGTPAPIDRSFLAGRLAEAAARRAPLAEEGTTGYRLVHGEGDRLSGLVIDRYERTLVIKLYSAAWALHLPALLAALQEVVPLDKVVLRLSRSVARQPEYLNGLTNGSVLIGSPPDGPVVFRENNLSFEADVLRGQKTGFFLDQRENRVRVETLAGGKAVLNVFAYTGGFAVYAARGGATAVINVDSSALALAAAERNFARNRHLPPVAAAQAEYLVEDAFAALARLAQQGRAFDLVVVDPPAFAKRESEAPRALAAYERLAALALGVLRPAGTLVMASCSSRVSEAEFFAAVDRGASRVGRPLRALAHTGHPLDHPVAIPEGAYLKCLYAIALPAGQSGGKIGQSAG